MNNSTTKDLLDENTTPFTKNLYQLVKVTLYIGNTPYITLADSGREVNCINTDTFNKIHDTEPNLVSILPIANVTLIGYNGRLNKKVRKQALITLTVGGQNTHECFIVVDNLYSTVLIGCDTLFIIHC